MRGLLLGLAMLLLTGCFTTTPLQSTMDLPLNGLYPVAAIKTSIQAAATDREWRLRPDGSHAYIGELRVREHFIKVRLDYSKDGIKAIYLDSRNMNYDGTVIHKKYHMWIDRLFVSIRKYLQEQAP